MQKPRHLAKDYAEQFADRSVARAYRTRPPYPSPLFELLARLVVDEARFEQSVEHYVESFHSRNGFSRERMGPTADAFDRELLSLLERFGVRTSLTMAVATNVVWGRPIAAERCADLRASDS